MNVVAVKWRIESGDADHHDLCHGICKKNVIDSGSFDEFVLQGV
jgi:hypothetical protein